MECRITDEVVKNPHEEGWEDEPDCLIMKEAMYVITESQINELKTSYDAVLTSLHMADDARHAAGVAVLSLRSVLDAIKDNLK